MVDNLAEVKHINKSENRGKFEFIKRPFRTAMGALLFLQTLVIPTAIWANSQERQEVSNQYLIDVMIHQSLPPDQTEQWARDTIENYINRKFEDAEIKQRLFINKVISNYDERNGCPDGGVKKNPNDNVCTYEDNSKIRVWLFAQGHSGGVPVTSANPESAQVWIALPLLIDPTDYYGSVRNQRSLTHEIGHLFKMPDYYSEVVPASDNHVAPITIRPFAQDIMEAVKYDHFSSISKGFADRAYVLPSGFGTPSWRIQYTPKNTILRIIDDDGLPMNRVSIEVFPQKWEFPAGSRAHQIIPSSPAFNDFTNDKGEFELGNYFRIFDNPTGSCACDSALLRLTSGGSIKYAAVTTSYLNYLYFQGNEDTAVVTLAFSAFHTLEENHNLYLSAPGVAAEPY